jgi:hypothetical protein
MNRNLPGRVLSAVRPTVLTPASPGFHIACPTIAELLRLQAVRSAPRGSPSAASRPGRSRSF